MGIIQGESIGSRSKIDKIIPVNLKKKAVYHVESIFQT